MVRSKPSSTGARRRRICERSPCGTGSRAPAFPCAGASSFRERSRSGPSLAGSRSTALAGAAAPSKAQDNPPNAIMLVPTAALTKVTACPGTGGRPAASLAIAQNTTMLAESTSSRLHNTGRSRKRVACHCRSSSRRRRDVNRSTVHAARPNRRSSLAAGGSHRQPIGVVGVALRLANLRCVAIAPDRALAQQPVRGEPGAASSSGRPPGVGRQHESGR